MVLLEVVHHHLHNWMSSSGAGLLQDFSDLDEDTATGYQTGQL